MAAAASAAAVGAAGGAAAGGLLGAAVTWAAIQRPLPGARVGGLSGAVVGGEMAALAGTGPQYGFLLGCTGAASGAVLGALPVEALR